LNAKPFSHKTRRITLTKKYPAQAGLKKVKGKLLPDNNSDVIKLRAFSVHEEK
jgi:hypothetical protein